MLAFFNVAFELRGARKLQGMLHRLPKRMQRKWLIRGLNAGAGVMKRSMPRATPSETGLLRRSWRVRKRRYRDRQTLGYTASVKSVRKPVRRLKGRIRTTGLKTATKLAARGEKIAWRNPARYAHLVHYGHRIVRGGRVVGRTRSNKWAVRVFRSKEKRVLAAVMIQIRKGIRSVRA